MAIPAASCPPVPAPCCSPSAAAVAAASSSFSIRLPCCKSYELEYDSYQPYFYPDDYGPEKFELLPTPPLSPSRAGLAAGRAAGQEEGAAGAAGGGGEDWVSELLLLDEDQGPRNLNAIILQDCMWSGFSAREKLEKVVSDKLQAAAAQHQPQAQGTPTPPAATAAAAAPPTHLTLT
uniref:Transcription regulator Myc N-terminal domain-containing protein n=1 Tax=Callorhinchus milii TaxID=7868 RepID=A0A4W3GC13_CALMI